MMLLVLFACGPADWEAYEDERIAVVCERTFECYDADELAALGMDDVATCEAAHRALAAADDDEASCDYRSARAGACLRELRKQSCEELEAYIEPEACGEVCDAE